jgi:hypothetical protein
MSYANRFVARFEVVRLFGSIELHDIESALVGRINELIANRFQQITSVDELAFVRECHAEEWCH